MAIINREFNRKLSQTPFSYDSVDDTEWLDWDRWHAVEEYQDLLDGLSNSEDGSDCGGRRLSKTAIGTRTLPDSFIVKGLRSTDDGQCQARKQTRFRWGSANGSNPRPTGLLDMAECAGTAVLRDATLVLERINMPPELCLAYPIRLGLAGKPDPD